VPAVQHLYRMLAMLCEALCFVYIGVALPMLGSRGMKASWPVALVMVVLCVSARGVSTFVCTHLINYFRAPDKKISPAAKLVIWMAGLRGGVAFALATAAAKIVTNG
jgi:NhaP-type Na+/H+ or K+/H+ antiporter